MFPSCWTIGEFTVPQRTGSMTSEVKRKRRDALLS